MSRKTTCKLLKNTIRPTSYDFFLHFYLLLIAASFQIGIVDTKLSLVLPMQLGTITMLRILYLHGWPECSVIGANHSSGMIET